MPEVRLMMSGTRAAEGADAVFDGVRSVYLTGFQVVFGEVVAHVVCGDVHAGLALIRKRAKRRWSILSFHPSSVIMSIT